MKKGARCEIRFPVHGAVPWQEVLGCALWQLILIQGCLGTQKNLGGTAGNVF